MAVSEIIVLDEIIFDTLRCSRVKLHSWRRIRVKKQLIDHI